MKFDAVCSTLLTFSLNKLVFRKCLIDLLVAVLRSSGSYSTDVRLSSLLLSSVPQAYILQVSDWAFCSCPQFLRLILYWCLIELCSCPQFRRAKSGTILKNRNHYQVFCLLPPVLVFTDWQFEIQGTSGQIALPTRSKGTSFIVKY